MFIYCQASDRFNINSQLEHLQAKYVGTGHADLSRLSVSNPFFPSNLSFFFLTKKKERDVADISFVEFDGSEWAVNIQRDSYASYIGHYPMLAYFAVAENESIGRERYNFMPKMLLSCGMPTKREDD